MKNNAAAIVIIAICSLCLLVGVGDTISRNISEKSKGNYNKERLKTVLSTGNKIALIAIDGPIDSSSQKNFMKADFSAQGALKSLKSCQKDPSVKGILIKINSPGGTVGMSQNLYDAIMEVRKTKPVVVSMDDVAASGGYYIACAADRIFAQKGTLTGSIGVIFSTMDVHQLLSDKFLVKPNVIKSGKYKDLASPYKAMTPDEKQLLQELVDDSYSQFLDAIKNGRISRNDNYSVEKTKLTEAELNKYADGRVFTGNQAKKLGFVDALGDTTKAHEAVCTMASEKFKLMSKDLPLVPYNKNSSFSEIFLSSTESIFKGGAGYFDEFLPLSVRMGRKPLYLWE